MTGVCLCVNCMSVCLCLCVSLSLYVSDCTCANFCFSFLISHFSSTMYCEPKGVSVCVFSSHLCIILSVFVCTCVCVSMSLCIVYVDLDVELFESGNKSSIVISLQFRNSIIIILFRFVLWNIYNSFWVFCFIH